MGYFLACVAAVTVLIVAAFAYLAWQRRQIDRAHAALDADLARLGIGFRQHDDSSAP